MRGTAAALSAAFLAVALGIYVTRPLSSGMLLVFSDTLPILAALFAGAATLYVAASFHAGDSHRRVWVLVGAGLFLWFLGELSWALMEVAFRIKVPFPSIADAFWLLGYVPIFLGLGSGFRRLDIRVRRVPFAVPLGILGTLAAVYLLVMFVPIIGSDIPLAEKLLDLAYPLGDWLILIPAVFTLFTLRHGVLAKPWLALVAGFLLMVVADSLFSYMTFRGFYRTGSMIDLVWVAGYLVIALASLQQAQYLKS